MSIRELISGVLLLMVIGNVQGTEPVYDTPTQRSMSEHLTATIAGFKIVREQLNIQQTRTTHLETRTTNLESQGLEFDRRLRQQENSRQSPYQAPNDHYQRQRQAEADRKQLEQENAELRRQRQADADRWQLEQENAELRRQVAAERASRQAASRPRHTAAYQPGIVDINRDATVTPYYQSPYSQRVAQEHAARQQQPAGSGCNCRTHYSQQQAYQPCQPAIQYYAPCYQPRVQYYYCPVPVCYDYDE